MKLTISIESNNDILSVDIPESMKLADFKAYIMAETEIAPEEQVLKHNAKSISDTDKSLEQIGIKNDDLILVGTRQTRTSENTDTGGANSTGAIDFQVEGMRQQFLSNGALSEQLRQSNPMLHSLLNRPSEFKNAVMGSLQHLQNEGFDGGGSYANQEELRRLQENPDDPESQERIFEMIRQQQVDENMQLAYDILPESFTSVNMLYIKIKVNGVEAQAFVDSGAQTTIISPQLAEKCGISRLIDKRFVGEARGVGSQKIEGKIHSVPISIGDSNMDIPCSFIVMDTSVDLLFGLDMLRRHKCVLDLQRDVLVVGGNIETRFLHEKEIQSSSIFGGSSSSGPFQGPGVPLGPGNSLPNVPSNTTPSPAPKGAAPQSAAQAASDAARRRHENSNSKVNQQDVNQLMSLGFSKEEAQFALEQTQGNVDMAASLLFQ